MMRKSEYNNVISLISIHLLGSVFVFANKSKINETLIENKKDEV